MPIEARTITFTNREVMKALIGFCGATDRKLATQETEGLSFSNDSEVKITLEFATDAPAMTFMANEVAVALILYCNKKSIPVARRSIRSLQVTQDSVALHLTIK
jgi:hypothetical protein